MYDALAPIYDNAFTLDYAEEMVERTEAAFAKHAVQPGRLVDLACGTGTFALEMASRWWDVTGVDASAAMLAEAERKAKRAPRGDTVRWSEQDMRSFSVDTPADVVTCYYDSLNHLLTTEDLEAAMARVREALRPGGLFLFDVNTVLMFEAVWSGASYFFDLDDRAVGWTLSYDPGTRRGTGRVVAFVRDGEAWARTEDEVVEVPYADGDVRTALERAGLAFVSRESFNPVSATSDDPLKDFYVARRAP